MFAAGLRIKKGNIEKALKEQKEGSILYTAASFYGVPILDLLSIGLFYHIPVKNTHICNEKIEYITEQYNAGKISRHSM